MYKVFTLIGFVSLLSGISGCDRASIDRDDTSRDGHGSSGEAEPLKGPHGGRMLVDGDFSLELTIFETGVPPEFRVWASIAGTPIMPSEIELRVTLTRLGNVTDEIGFTSQDDFLRGDTVVYEPHSFVVSVEATHSGKSHHWTYDNFEGRTRIGTKIAAAFGLETEVAGAAVIRETVTVYGRVEANSEQYRTVSARFEGVIQSVRVSAGDTVRAGESLATIESNDSLSNYSLTAPIAGVISERSANPGEQTAGRHLFTIIDTSSVWAELAVFPSDRARVREGSKVIVRSATSELTREGTVARLAIIAQPNQSVLARVVLDNADGALIPGTHLTGEIEVATHAVPLAVRRTGLQSFRDFTVVYAQIGDEYEVRMLELGREDDEWSEVLSGLDVDTRYVITNSFLVKADIEKSGASHDH